MNIILFRIEESLVFVNISTFKTYIRQIKEKIKNKSLDIKIIIIDFSCCNRIDANAIHMFFDLIEEFNSDNILLLFSNLNNNVSFLMKKSGLIDFHGKNYFFQNLNEVFNHIEKVNFFRKIYK